MRCVCVGLYPTYIFGHNNIIHLQKRPYKSVEEMNDAMIAQWNSQVSKGDIVYVLGDFSFGNYKQTKTIVERLNGTKILIRGNHDERFTSGTFINLGFKDVYNYLTLKLGGIKVVLNHYPYRHPWYIALWKKLTGKTWVRWYQQFFLKDMGMPLMHGHNHNGKLFDGRLINVAWDINKRLISESEIVKHLKGLKLNGQK